MNIEKRVKNIEETALQLAKIAIKARK